MITGNETLEALLIGYWLFMFMAVTALWLNFRYKEPKGRTYTTMRSPLQNGERIIEYED
jgi:hypothetical protein